MSLNYISYGADVMIDPGALETFYLIQLPQSGTATITNGSKTFTSNRETASILDPDRPTRMTWWRGCAHALIQIDRQTLHGFAERLLRRELPGGIAFDPVIDLTDPRFTGWCSLVRRIFAEGTAGRLSHHGAELSQAYLEHTLLEQFLRFQQSNISPFLAGPTGHPAPRHVRLADDFMRANAHRALSIDDLADAAGVSVRALQYAYRRQYDCTPMRALERERLCRIRSELLEKAGAISVSATARRWGFSHLGRFAAKYRREFGELPRETAAST